MPARCDQCGTEEYMPYVCKFCKGRFCAAHRLPENHGCSGLDAYRERARQEGRILRPEPDVVAPRVSTGARARLGMERFWGAVDGKMTYVLLGTIVGVYLLQRLVALGLPRLYDDLFVVQRDFLLQPWTILTSIFAHSIGSFNHILFNSLVLYFFGTNVERLIGTRRFTWLFLGSGAAAGVVQVLLFGGSALGASGALLGIMGTLVVLAPTLTVLVFFVIPAPLWLITALYALADILGILAPAEGDTTAHLAHLVGLAIGLAYGYRLRQQGLRVRAAREPSVMRRYF